MTESRSFLSSLQRGRAIPVVLLLVVLLAAANWYLAPSEALRWLRVGLTLPAIWLALSVWHRLVIRAQRRQGSEDEPAVTRYFGSVLALVVLALGFRQIALLCLTIWVATGHQGADLDVERRVLGVATSAMLVVLGNAVPKILTPLSMVTRVQAALVTEARRFVGTLMLLVGLSAGVAYLVAPLELARLLLRWGTVASVLATAAAVVWMNLRAASLEG